jgi:hypothetical protein
LIVRRLFAVMIWHKFDLVELLFFAAVVYVEEPLK